MKAKSTDFKIDKKLMLSSLAIVAYVVCNLVFIPFLLLICLMFFYSKKRRQAAISKCLMAFTKFYVDSILPFFDVCYKPEIFGLENVKEDGVIYVSNHRSYLDPIYLLSRIPNCSVLIKRKYNSWLAVWFLVKFFDIVMVDEVSPKSLEFAAENCKKILSKGRNLLIFPEGSRSPSRRLQPFKSLAYRLAQDLKIPIVNCVVFSELLFLSRAPDSLILNRRNRFTIKFLSESIPQENGNYKTLLADSERKISKVLAVLDAPFKK